MATLSAHLTFFGEEMHELAVTKSILEVVLKKQEEAGATKILAITIDAGEMRNLEEEWVQRYFERSSQGTPAEGAIIHVNRIPLVFHCDDCNADFSSDIHRRGAITCAYCGGDNYDIKTGRELTIRNMEFI